MGTLAKWLGQISARRLETESARILRTGRANKKPGSLSLSLDGTLKQGHDMYTFGMGTAASLSSVDRYSRFTFAMLNIYSVMEDELDKSSKYSEALQTVWGPHGSILKRGDALQRDLLDVVNDISVCKITPATDEYLTEIRTAGRLDRENAGARLLGHLYCRYFADLFGGQALRYPTQVALALPENTPRHYKFDFATDRKDLIESVYDSLNIAGSHLNMQQKNAVIDEALKAFALNAKVYGEEPCFKDGLLGAANVLSGTTVKLLKHKSN